jgi:hypothetical protein
MVNKNYLWQFLNGFPKLIGWFEKVNIACHPIISSQIHPHIGSRQVIELLPPRFNKIMQNGRICRPLDGSADFSFTGTYLPAKPPSSVKCCRVCVCAAHSVWKARWARWRAGATPAQRNAIIVSPLQQGTATSHVLLDQCSGERERERERRSMAHTMAGKWRPFMRLRLQLLRRCFWGMMM